ncbi:MAG: Major Facilitator Superfamily protein [Methanosaeta sp. PtaU1.Bin112]|nr:MAG: Major Facilitator Superfamily protein [Methanosaeta sp. PtaU1.Bin112]
MKPPSIRFDMLSASNGFIARIKSFSPNAQRYLMFIFLTTLNVGIYGVIFNLYILSLGFTEDFLGLILSLSSVSIGLFAIPAAIVCDHVGRKDTLLISSSLLCLSLLFLYNTTSEELLVVFSIAYGMASALSLVTGATFLVENSTAYERMHLFSAYYIIYTFSTLSGNMIGGFLPSILGAGGSIAYRLTLYVSLAATVISLLPLAYITESPSRKDTSMARRIQVYKSIFRLKNVCRMVLFYCLFGIGWGMSLPYFNVYFDVVLGASASQIGLIFSLSQLVMIAGYFLVPMLTEKLGKIRMASAVQILSIPFLLIFIFSSSLPVAAFGYLVRYMLMNMANPILNSFKLEIVRAEQRSMINSIMWMACYSFVGIGTYAGGLMMAMGRNRVPFLITGIFYALTASMYFVFFNKFEKMQPVPSM